MLSTFMCKFHEDMHFYSCPGVYLLHHATSCLIFLRKYQLTTYQSCILLNLLTSWTARLFSVCLVLAIVEPHCSFDLHFPIECETEHLLTCLLAVCTHASFGQVTKCQAFVRAGLQPNGWFTHIPPPSAWV